MDSYYKTMGVLSSNSWTFQALATLSLKLLAKYGSRSFRIFSLPVQNLHQFIKSEFDIMPCVISHC